MEVILLKNLENLGEFGSRVKVSDGYARNFLFPRKLATGVSEVDARFIEAERNRIEKKRAQALDEAQKLADKLSKFKLTIKKKVGENEKLFGSVTSADVAEGLKKQGFELDRKEIILPEEHIKELGAFKASAKLHPQVKAEFKVKIEKEE
ncbi:MAG: 50S ribosomal protein L9 [bacterium]